MNTNKHKVLLNKPYLNSNDAVELLGLLIGTEIDLRDFIAIEAKHNLPVYYKGERLPAHRLCVVTESATSAKYIGHYDDNEDKTETVYFVPADIQALADVLNTVPSTPSWEEVNALKARIAELEAQTSAPQQSALLLIGRCLELYQSNDKRRYTQTRYVGELLDDQDLHSFSERTVNGLLAEAKKALANARKA